MFLFREVREAVLVVRSAGQHRESSSRSRRNQPVPAGPKVAHVLVLVDDVTAEFTEAFADAELENGDLSGGMPVDALF